MHYSPISGIGLALAIAAGSVFSAPARADDSQLTVVPSSLATLRPLLVLAGTMGEAARAAARGLFVPTVLGSIWPSDAKARLQPVEIQGIGDALLSTGSISATRTFAKKPVRPQAELMASVAIPFGKLPALSRMNTIYDDMDAGIFVNCRTEACRAARTTLEAAIATSRRGRFLDMLGAVNRSVNKMITYRSDRDAHGVLDHWAKPSQTLESGVGDCEDYALLKMAVLAEAGVPKESMSLVVLRDERRGLYHAVLAIRTTQGSFILDNLNAVVQADHELPDYMPLYSVSAGRGYIYGRRTGKSTLTASAKFDAIAPGEGLEAYRPTRVDAAVYERSEAGGPR